MSFPERKAEPGRKAVATTLKHDLGLRGGVPSDDAFLCCPALPSARAAEPGRTAGHTDFIGAPDGSSDDGPQAGDDPQEAVDRRRHGMGRGGGAGGGRGLWRARGHGIGAIHPRGPLSPSRMDDGTQTGCSPHDAF